LVNVLTAVFSTHSVKLSNISCQIHALYFPISFKATSTEPHNQSSICEISLARVRKLEVVANAETRGI